MVGVYGEVLGTQLDDLGAESGGGFAGAVDDLGDAVSANGFEHVEGTGHVDAKDFVGRAGHGVGEGGEVDDGVETADEGGGAAGVFEIHVEELEIGMALGRAAVEDGDFVMGKKGFDDATANVAGAAGNKHFHGGRPSFRNLLPRFIEYVDSG